MTGFYIPPIPQKKALGNKDSLFVKKRWYVLNRFVHGLCEIEYLWASKELLLFLDAEMQVEQTLVPLPTPSEYEKAVKCSEWMQVSSGMVNEGNKMFY